LPGLDDVTPAVWFLLIGVLMLTRGITSAALKRLPVTPAILYLGVGLLIGPCGLGWFSFDPIEAAPMLEVLTEIAVLISLFSAGVKMPVPVTWERWHPPVRLAWLSMAMTVGLVAVFSHVVLGLAWGAAVLLGAVLAPTDPVLATDVQSRHPGDNDALRFTLTCEAGLNDGTAFPFVILGLGLLGVEAYSGPLWHWALFDVLWATLGAIAIGTALGWVIARQVWRFRRSRRGHEVFDDLIGLGLIAVVYGASLLADTWGFLAVFAAAVALRQQELVMAQSAGVPPEQMNADVDVPVEAPPDDPPPATVSAEALIFKEHLERLSELLLVLLLGGMLTLESWTWRTVGLAVFLFAVARPIGTMLGLVYTRTPMRIRGIASWFGVRGIGSLYYLVFAIQHGLPTGYATDLMNLTLVTVALSIVLHGTSVKPLIARLWPRGSTK
jgi:NhaP-type Na+/H+ or K+/H+ antiporter